ncbi:MAG: PAS domain-containing protein [Brevundimonas sp.]|nr:PAS domain-containing protein [Brevundimonas sp.]
MARAFDASPNPYTMLTRDFCYAGVNQAYLDAVGREREDLIGRNLFDLFDGGGQSEQAHENARQLRASFERVLKNGEPDHLALIHYPIEVTDADGLTRIEDRYWSATHTPIRGADGKVAYILQHTMDITELQNLRKRVLGDQDKATVMDLLSSNVMARAEHLQSDNLRLQSERNRLLDIFMQTPGFIAVLTGPNFVFQMHNEAYAELTGHRSLNGRPMVEAMPEIVAQGFLDLLKQVRDTGETFEGRAMPVQLSSGPDGALRTHYLNFVYQPLRDGQGDVAGVFVQGHDVTDVVEAGNRQKLMIDELNHRVKNTLATVQSIAMQTARTHADPESFAEGFQARLMSLSHTHNLLTRTHWEGAELADILTHETEAHGATRILPNGPAVSLDPAQALSLGMIFHELATNAAKHGALQSGDGRVLVDWSVQDGQVSLVWREIDGPPVAVSEHKGFGSRLMERNVRHDLAGQCRFDYAPDGLIFSLTFPLERMRHE